MKSNKTTYYFGFPALMILFMNACVNHTPQSFDAVIDAQTTVDSTIAEKPKITFEVPKEVPIRTYFEYMDTVVAHFNAILPYELTEHVIVHANPWIIDTLAHSDYDYQKPRGVTVMDPKAWIALPKGAKLHIPDSLETETLKKRIASFVIDVNIPEFKLRILEGNVQKAVFPVRVGKTSKRYLAMAGREVDMRTIPGEGQIVRINRNPAFINPRDNKRYKDTGRDDGIRTKLPLVPWIEPTIDGQRHGQLIHPTTNPRTLGRMASNGCVGVGEGDMWRVYYHAPMGTKVVYRYDLDVLDEEGKAIKLKNIYPGFEKRKKRQAIIAAAFSASRRDDPQECYCGELLD